ncbi:MAG: alpha-amylase family glycosyl hydrolase [Actinobacteria bacterium]|nr:alpha-amylase family glycosyl hydrolase [Actinomycetota bacterium]
MIFDGSNESLWWREAVFYQIYPLSFSDSDGDGFGDLTGIISKLDYLSDTLGVDALWLSPFYRSPMRDWGYDISDHTDVDPLFGDVHTAERLIEEAHRHGLRVIVDYVMNHTSDEHPWFIEARSSRESSKRDWYVWSDPKPDGSPPNNWVSVFSGPAWTLDEASGQFYRHTYLPHQPDLNWRNEETVQAALDVARFWLDRGADGFRLDAAHQMMKDPRERDNPPVPDGYERPWKDMGEYDDFVHLYDLGHQDIHDVHRLFRSVVDSYPHHPYTVGEIHIFDLPEWATYYGENLDQLHMPFNFHLMACDWDAGSLRVLIETVLWHVPPGGWTNWTLGNHDENRLATRLGAENARLAALLLLTLRGTPFLYYGDELGMQDVEIAAGEGKDPWGENVSFLSRDGARTPMQWDSSADAGFGSDQPWLPVNADYKRVNVQFELEDPGSMLNLYRRLLAYRKSSKPLRSGSFLTHPSSNEDVYVFERSANSETVIVAINLSSEVQMVDIEPGRVVVSTAPTSERLVGREGLLLPKQEAVIIEPDV